MVLRKLGKSEEEVLANTKTSIVKAKEAVALDVSDGDSWYVLGNAHLAHFFLIGTFSNIKELHTTLAAFKQAEKTIYGLNKMDMYFNRSTVHRYLEDYGSAIKDLSLALAMDPDWSSPKVAINAVVEMLTKIKVNIDKKGNLKPKKIRQMVQNLPKKDTKIDNLFVTSVTQLEIGENVGKVVVGVIVSLICNPAGIPVTIVMIDSEENSVAVSIYNIVPDALNIGNQLTLLNPKLKQIKLEREEQVTQYNTIVVDIPSHLKINGKDIQQENLIKTSISITQK